MTKNQFRRIWDLLDGLPKYMEIAIDQLDTMTFHDWERKILKIQVPLDKQEMFFNDLFKYSWERFSNDFKKILLSTTYFMGESPSIALQHTCGIPDKDYLRALSLASDTYIESTKSGYTVHPLTHAYCKAVLNSESWTKFKSESGLRFIKYFLEFTKLANQTNDIDSQEKEIRNIVNAANLTEKLEAWDYAINLRTNVTSFIRHRGYWQEEIDITLPAVKACRALGRNELLAKYLVYDLGWLYLRLEKTDLVELVVNEGLEIFQKLKDRKGEAQAKRHLGKRSLLLGLDKYYEPNEAWDTNSDLSEKYYQESLSIRQQLFNEGEDQLREIADMKLDFGRFYWLDGKRKETKGRLKNNNELILYAYEKYEQSNRENQDALQIFEKINNEGGITKTWGNFGNTTKEIAKYFINEKRWKEASKNISEALKFYKKNLEDGKRIKRKDEISHALWGISEIQELYADNPNLANGRQNRMVILKKALDAIEESYQIYTSLGGTKDINATKRVLDRIKSKLEIIYKSFNLDYSK